MPTALLSVYDKTGIAGLAEGLHAAGWRLLSSGGTAREIAAGGVAVLDIAELTGVPAILGHRVVTLHPKVHGGILADVTDPGHRADMAEHGIEPIDLVVVNLYPFGSDPGIELIDIGGPAMVRAAAKNHDRVAVVVDPADYESVLGEIRGNGAVSAARRRELARKAFAITAAYDGEIARWLATDVGEPSKKTAATSHRSLDDGLPEELNLSLQRAQSLRYGENPHQQGARYRFAGGTSWWDGAVQHGGKELSYLNLYDTEAAWRLVHRFAEPACVIVKHANPCGVAVAADVADAYARAHACDPVSAFGGIIAANRPVTATMAEAISSVLTEVVVAPDFEPGAIDTLTTKKNLRVLTAPAPSPLPFDIRPIDGGALVQQPDPVSTDRSAWRVVTDLEPTAEQWQDLEFAWVVCAAVSSNAIVLAKHRQALGIGAGQQNRVDSARIAAERAGDRIVGGVCASDAFFPFRDGLDAAAAAGVAAVVQPGGSLRDDEVIAAANEHGIAMVFTGERHFRH
ncbi:MAG: bifunctional phosphoribosylaminoimidazolecarboxamide formyltransferase/IMP cyclohydrolase [Acidimicrobiales bacterium]